MAVDMFFKIEGIDGEAQDGKADEEGNQADQQPVSPKSRAVCEGAGCCKGDRGGCFCRGACRRPVTGHDFAHRYHQLITELGQGSDVIGGVGAAPP